MSHAKPPVNIHNAYHAHVYFEKETLDFARRFCEQTCQKFDLLMGRVHQKPVGPHPKWSCQIKFTRKHFDELIPWLDLHRDQLSILIHGLTGDNLKDHTDYAYWLGQDIELNLDIFKAMKE